MRGAALLLALVLALSVAEAQEGPRELVSFDFVLYYWPRHARQAETAAEAARTALPRLYKTLGLESRGRISMHLASTAEEFRELTGGSDPNRILGQAFPAQRKVVLQPLSGEPLRKLVAHELMHILLEDAVAETGARIPAWLHEGLARYASEDFSPGDRVLLARAVNDHELIPLEELEQAFRGPPEKVSLAYAQAYTLVDLLAQLSPEESLAPFLRQLGQVGEVQRALLRTYGLTPEELAEKWERQILEEYLGRSMEEAATPLIWAGMVVLFAIGVSVRLRQMALIRRRLEEQEREHQGWPGEPPPGEA